MTRPRDRERRRERWIATHRGHKIRRNVRGDLRCLSCERIARRRVLLADTGLVDEVVITRLLAGKEVGYSSRERDVAVHRMVAARINHNDIARQLGLSWATLTKILRAPVPVEEFDEDGFYGELDELDGPPEGWGDDDVGLAVAA